MDAAGDAARDYAEELLGFFRHRVRGGDEAQDLRQEVFLRLSRAPSGSEIVDLRAYCFRVARNLLVDFHRSGQARTQVFDSFPATEDAACAKPTPEIAVAGRQDLRLLREAVADLPPHLRQALLWARIDGVRLAEIGRRLGVSESMAGRYVTQALMRCRARLARLEP